MLEYGNERGEEEASDETVWRTPKQSWASCADSSRALPMLARLRAK